MNNKKRHLRPKTDLKAPLVVKSAFFNLGVIIKPINPISQLKIKFTIFILQYPFSFHVTLVLQENDANIRIVIRTS
jgi:hypothetical protein